MVTLYSFFLFFLFSIYVGWLKWNPNAPARTCQTLSCRVLVRRCLAWWRYFVSGGVRVTHFHQFNDDDDNSDGRHHHARQRPQFTGLLLSFCVYSPIVIHHSTIIMMMSFVTALAAAMGFRNSSDGLRAPYCLFECCAQTHARAFRIIIMYSLRFINICDDDVGCQVECVFRRMPCRRFMMRDDAWIVRMQISFAHLKSRWIALYLSAPMQWIIIEFGPTEICFFFARFCWLHCLLIERKNSLKVNFSHALSARSHRNRTTFDREISFRTEMITNFVFPLEMRTHHV